MATENKPSSGQTAPKGKSGGKFIKPITLAIRKKPLLSSILFVVYAASAGIAFHYISKQEKFNLADRIKSPDTPHAIKANYCEDLSNRSTKGLIKDVDIRNFCDQIQGYKKLIALLDSNPDEAILIDSLRYFLTKYEDVPKEASYYKVVETLDTLLCEQAKKAPEKNTLAAYKEYIDEMGPSGKCYDEFTYYLDSLDCTIAQNAPDGKKMQALQEYLDKYGTDGRCSEAFAQELNLCRVLLSISSKDSCDLLKDYLNKNGGIKACYLEVKKKVKSLCKHKIPGDLEEPDLTKKCQSYRVGGMLFEAIKIGPLLVMCGNVDAPVGNSICYNYDEINCRDLGELYTYPEALNACPKGWRLPCHSEIEFLINTYYSNPRVAFENWSSRVKAQFGGYAKGNTFSNIDLGGYFWCATELGDSEAFYYHFDLWQQTIINGDTMDKTNRLSCRCVRVADRKEYSESRISNVNCHNQMN